jgi:hypothetical protein
MAEPTRSDAETAHDLLRGCRLDGDLRLGTSFVSPSDIRSEERSRRASQSGLGSLGCGGFVLGAAAAAWLAASKPESQRPLMMGLATAFTLVTLALLYGNLAGDYRGVQWLSWLQILGQWGPGGRNVVANIQICCVDNFWLRAPVFAGTRLDFAADPRASGRNRVDTVTLKSPHEGAQCMRRCSH